MNYLKITDDGSHTFYNKDLGEHYHSTHGAIQESQHVFIDAGLKETAGNISILEVGFGTGLNALLSFIESGNSRRTLLYTTLELYPLAIDEVIGLNYPDILGHSQEFIHLHNAAWSEWQKIGSQFSIKKVRCDFRTVIADDLYDVVFFDAFSPQAQPELWTVEVFSRIARMCNPGAILTTFSAKGSVRRALTSAGFTVERIPGPPGKREMLRARLC
ncbi:MAG: tRNA (5-methylaminomethyl-2-thiouridine)(34)-methyltransferase MnmD [Flavobacteriales bacterium]|nr:tRNA (5-methylaminomethyl-2-thiouridine)(34)-methyltransferase MnmD [Flavobacteriales bacterium]